VKRPVLDQGAPAGPRHFTCKSPYKVARVKSPSAFRLRRLAQSACLGLGVRHFPYNFGDLCQNLCPVESCFVRLVLSSIGLLLHSIRCAAFDVSEAGISAVAQDVVWCVLPSCLVFHRFALTKNSMHPSGGSLFCTDCRV
jgi:hypothetical protein